MTDLPDYFFPEPTPANGDHITQEEIIQVTKALDDRPPVGRLIGRYRAVDVYHALEREAALGTIIPLWRDEDKNYILRWTLSSSKKPEGDLPLDLSAYTKAYYETYVNPSLSPEPPEAIKALAWRAMGTPTEPGVHMGDVRGHLHRIADNAFEKLTEKLVAQGANPVDLVHFENVVMSRIALDVLSYSAEELANYPGTPRQAFFDLIAGDEEDAGIEAISAYLEIGLEEN